MRRIIAWGRHREPQPAKVAVPWFCCGDLDGQLLNPGHVPLFFFWDVSPRPPKTTPPASTLLLTSPVLVALRGELFSPQRPDLAGQDPPQPLARPPLFSGSIIFENLSSP